MNRLGMKGQNQNSLKRQRLIGLFILAVLIAIRIWDPLLVQLLRLQSFDVYQKTQTRTVTEHQIVIVDIDEPSLARYGQWPWPRNVVAELVRKMVDSGAKVIGFDIVFAEPDRLSPPHIAKSLVNLDQASKKRLERLPDHDTLLADAFGETPVVVSESGLEKRNLPLGNFSPRKPTIIEIGEDPKPFIISYAGLLPTIPKLEEAAAGHGVISISPEPDGVVRRVPAILRVGEHILPALSLEMFRVASGASHISVQAEFEGVRGVKIAETFIPTDRAGRVWVHFARRHPQQYLSAMSLLNSERPFGILQDKLVLIGTSAVGLSDIKVTPVDGSVPGVEVHAQMLSMMLGQSFLTRPNWVLATEALSLFFLGLVIIYWVPRFRALSSMLLTGSIFMGVIGASWYAYSVQGVLLDASFGVLGLLGLYGYLSYNNYVREEQSQRRIRNTFSRYLSPTLVDQLARHSAQLKLGGETKLMTVMFCDVREFTSISEQFQSDPQGLTQLLNSLLTPLTEVILRHKGTIDKYMGDNIMAFWNAPLDDPDHAFNACQAALEMVRSLEHLNASRFRNAQAKNQPFIPLKVGIGINTGSCVVGNLGSEQRFDYSVLGDPVNIASRLEGQSKRYELEIVIGPQTAEQVRDRLALLEVDLITLKGKEKPARTYTVLGNHQLHTASQYQNLMKTHLAMLVAFRSREWPRAQTLLKECRENPHAPLGVYAQYEKRIDHYQQQPPPPDWEGAFVATTK